MMAQLLVARFPQEAFWARVKLLSVEKGGEEGLPGLIIAKGVKKLLDAYVSRISVEMGQK